MLERCRTPPCILGRGAFGRNGAHTPGVGLRRVDRLQPAAPALGCAALSAEVNAITGVRGRGKVAAERLAIAAGQDRPGSKKSVAPPVRPAIEGCWRPGDAEGLLSRRLCVGRLPRSRLAHLCAQHLAHVADLLIVDRMPHACIDTLGNVGSQSGEDAR